MPKPALQSQISLVLLMPEVAQPSTGSPTAGPVSFSEVADRFREDPAFYVQELGTLAGVQEAVKRADRSIVLAHAGDVSAATAIWSFLKMARAWIEADKLQVLVTIGFQDPSLWKALRDAGCKDIVESPISEKLLSAKIRMLGEVAQSETRVVRQEAPVEKPATTPRDRPRIHLTPPLDLLSDCWISRGTNARKVMEKWIVPLKGPSPIVGRWVELTSMNQGIESCWQWIPTDPVNDAFIREEGTWMFRGQRPEIRDDLWMFVGRNPELAFYHENEPYGHKLKTEEDGSLCIARDSENALKALPAILATWEKIIRPDVTSDSSKNKPEEGAQKKPAGPLTPDQIVRQMRAKGSPIANKLTPDPEPEPWNVHDSKDGPKDEQEAEYGKNHGRALELLAQEFDEKVEKKIREKSAELPEGLLEAIEKAKNTGIRTATYAMSEALEKNRKRDGPFLIKAPRPPGPSISPLAIAFLVSELLSRPERDLRYILARYCAYVSASCGGLWTEVWLKDRGDWVLGAKSHRRKSLVHPMELEAKMSPDQRTLMVDDAYRVAAIYLLVPGDPSAVPTPSLGGLLLMGGPGASLVDPAYLGAVAEMLTGISQSADLLQIRKAA